MKQIKYVILLAVIFLSVTPLVIAQSTNASLSGFITDVNNEPLTGAAVTLRNEETGFVTGSISALNGGYNIQQIPLGSRYTITVSYTGFTSQQVLNQAFNQGDQIRMDFVLQESTSQLDEIVVVADAMALVVDRMGAKTSISRANLEDLPVNGRNFVSLIDLSPVSRGNNLLGQLFSSTNFVIDGMTNRSPTSSGTTNRGPFSISMEAIREFEIVTNSYDVTYGRSGGGLVSAVTRSGTNTFSGSAFLYNRSDALSSQYDTRGQRRTQDFNINQFGVTLSGPIIRDKAHFFVTYDAQISQAPFYILDINNQQDEIVNGISQANLDRFLQIARDKYGVANSAQTGAFDQVRPTHTFFGRVDWQLDANNTVTIRNNFTRDFNKEGVNDNSRHNLYEVRGSHLSMANSFMASLRTTISPTLTNEFKAQYLYVLDDGTTNSQLPSANIPRAIVENITSSIDGRNYNTTIQLGGQRYLPESFESNLFQLVNNLYYTNKGINYTFGADVMFNNLVSRYTSEYNGRFWFTGLDNFDNLNPYRYAREVEVNNSTVDQNIMGAGIYAQAQFFVHNDVEMTVGLRGDYTAYFNKPVANALVLQELGKRTDVTAKGFQLQPRFQATWNILGKNTDIIKVGGGLMGSALNNYSDINNQVFDGTKVYAIDVRGAAVPTPNFPGYRADPSTAPGVDVIARPDVTPAITINMNDPDLKVPTVFKGNISYNRFFGQRLRLGANFIATLARNNYMYVEANMVDQPFFRLANEANRGVFVPVSAINTGNGSANWLAGRKSNQLGRVLELVSEGKNEVYTLVVDGTWQYYGDGTFSASYSRNSAKDNTSFNGNVANSAALGLMVVDDPRDLSNLTYSDAQWKDKVVFYGTLPTLYGFKVGVRYSGLGGTRYSLRVGGNVNGDFVNSNDLAFVFDPNNPNTAPAVAAAMQTILANEDNLARNCINKYMGKIAERNGCENGYAGTWDIRVSRKFMLPSKAGTGVELSFDMFNLQNVFDKNAGFNKFLGNQNLTNIRGFNAVTQEYIYAVNQNVGVSNPGGTPYQFQVSARVMF